MRESQINCNKIIRTNQNYLHIKKILLEVSSKILKINAIEHILYNRRQAFFISKHSKNKKETYLRHISLLDNSFSFDDMFFLNVDLNPDINFSTTKEDLEPLILLAEKKISIKEAHLRLAKKSKKKEIEAFNMKILNLFDKPFGTILLELDLNKPLEELQEILKLAKKFYDKQKNKIPTIKNIAEQHYIIDEKMFSSFLNKRSSNIPFEEKLIDLLFIIDCLILEYKPKEIKLLIQNYYIENYPQLDLSYILTDYYKTLLKEAKTILPKIKKGV